MSRRECLHEALCELVTSVWGLTPLREAADKAPASVKEILLCSRAILGAVEHTFVEENEGRYSMVHVCVSEPLKAGLSWKKPHSAALEDALLSLEQADDEADVSHFAAVVVDGPVSPEVLQANLALDRAVHVIESCVLSAADFSRLPIVVSPSSVCEEEDLSEISELPRVRAAAPEVQLLRAVEGDVLAYPPTSPEDAAALMVPSGQVFDWTARFVVGNSRDEESSSEHGGSSPSSSASSSSSSSASSSSDSEQ